MLRGKDLPAVGPPAEPALIWGAEPAPALSTLLAMLPRVFPLLEAATNPATEPAAAPMAEPRSPPAAPQVIAWTAPCTDFSPGCSA